MSDILQDNTDPETNDSATESTPAFNAEKMYQANVATAFIVAQLRETILEQACSAALDMAEAFCLSHCALLADEIAELIVSQITVVLSQGRSVHQMTTPVVLEVLDVDNNV